MVTATAMRASTAARMAAHPIIRAGENAARRVRLPGARSAGKGAKRRADAFIPEAFG
jgi:hypothetical protein